MLTQFYKEMQAWVDAGCQRHPLFIIRVGLCGNLAKWDSEHKTQLYEAQLTQFKSAGLNIAHPFDCNISYFERERERYLLYKNPKRLDWIKRHANSVL